MALQTHDTIRVSLTTNEVLSILAKDVEKWKAKAIRDNAVMRDVSGLLLIVEAGKYKVGDTLNNG